MKKLPLYLILFRLALAPVILYMAWWWKDEGRLAIVILLYLGLLSDIFDGIIARKQNVADTKLRRMDSQTDMIFWVSTGIAAWKLNPEIINAYIVPIIIIFAMEASCYLISIAKFSRETCTHAFLSKLWGISLLIAFTSLIGFSHAGFPFMFAIIMGFISHIDRILITLILPHWTHDIPSAYHAYLIRKGIPFKKNKLLN